MPAYLIVDVEILDPEPFSEYLRQAPALVERHGGRYLVATDRLAVLEGDWQPKRIVVVEFPTGAAAQAFYTSPEYQAILPLRTRHARTDMILVDGL